MGNGKVIRAKEMTGQRFGKLTVIERSGADKDGSAMWMCLCDCGGTRLATGHSLRRGHVLSCGCMRAEKREAGEKDLIGKRFGRLEVLEFVEHDKHHHSVWRCRCDCGNEKNVSRLSLVKGSCQSCGCYHKERTIESVRQDIAGEKFGGITALYRIDKKSNGKCVWVCQCECGKILESNVARLRGTEYPLCRACAVKRSGIKRRTHGLSKTPEYIRMIANKRREMKIKLDAGWTPEMEIELTKMFPSCVVCGSSIKMETDHVRPLFLGYGLIPGNAVKLCKHCNSSKRHKDIDNLSDEMRIPIIASALKFKIYWEKINA